MTSVFTEMLTGKRFRLKTDTMGIGTVDGKRVAVTVPADAIIEVTGGPRPNSLLAWALASAGLLQIFRNNPLAKKVVEARVGLHHFFSGCG
jgi:hypothetical protein